MEDWEFYEGLTRQIDRIADLLIEIRDAKPQPVIHYHYTVPPLGGIGPGVTNPITYGPATSGGSPSNPGDKQ